MRALVTGAGGFVGVHLVRHLEEQGDDVLQLERTVDGIDIAGRPGEVLGLLGDNGAGKSSLLKVMSGAHQPTNGTILVHGTPHRFSPGPFTEARLAAKAA